MRRDRGGSEAADWEAQYLGSQKVNGEGKWAGNGSSVVVFNVVQCCDIVWETRRGKEHVLAEV